MPLLITVLHFVRTRQAARGGSGYVVKYLSRYLGVLMNINLGAPSWKVTGDPFSPEGPPSSSPVAEVCCLACLLFPLQSPACSAVAC